MAAAPPICPSCRQPLTAAERWGVALLRCDACAGSWVADERVDALAAARWRAGAERRRLRGRVMIGHLAD